MARIINGQLYVPSFDPTGNPGEYTFTDALYENQADTQGDGAFAIQVGFLIYAQASDPNTYAPISGVSHCYKITNISSVTFSTISATVLWNEGGAEVDVPTSGTNCIISENTIRLDLGLPPSLNIYPYLPPGAAESAFNNNLRSIVDKLSVTGIQGVTGLSLQGVTGILGIDGQTGIMGVTGILGIDGQTGIQGVTGILGLTGLAGTEFYTGTAERTVGGIIDGQIFNSATMTQMWDSLIKQEKFPVLTAPSATFNSSITGFQEIGLITNIAFDATFNRGSINPQYSALSPYRSGLPNTYDYAGSGLVDQSTTNLTNSQAISGYTVVLGAQNWTSRVFFDAGVQPKSSYGNDFSTPLSAGSTNLITRTVTGVYPFFATTVTISVLTKLALAAHNATFVQTDMVAESGGFKQTTDFPVVWSPITGIQFFNTVSNTWEWINGSKANSLLTFSTSVTTHLVQGNTINYTRFVNNGATIGARQLRWYTN